MTKKITTLLLVLSTGLTAVPKVLAQTVSEINLGSGQRYGINPSSNPKILDTIIASGIRIMFAVGAVAVVFMVVWGAVEWIFSGGDKEKLAAARKRITHGLIGLVFLALSFVIIWVAGEILKFRVLDPLCLPILTAPADAQPSDTKNCI